MVLEERVGVLADHSSAGQRGPFRPPFHKNVTNSRPLRLDVRSVSPDGGLPPDGKRFLYALTEGATAQTRFMVVLDWQAALRK
jgi:hypothetical protein